MQSARMYLFKNSKSSINFFCKRSLHNIRAVQQNEFTKLEVDDGTNIAILQMMRPPANALNQKLLEQLKDSINYIEELKCRGLVLTSSSERIFSAGLDLTETYKPNEQNLTNLWSSLQNMWSTLFVAPFPTVACINGHATAGGCLIAIACDYRVIMPNVIIGLNETKAGIAAPQWVMDSYVNVMHSRRVAEADLIAGKLYRSDDALQVGLVDKITNTKNEALQVATEYITQFHKEGVNDTARARTKLQFRNGILHDFNMNRQRDLEIFLESIQRKDVQSFLGEYLAQLKSKSKSKH